MEIGRKVHIKIKILKEANVVQKVKRDLASRVNGVWTEKEDALYFEDDVIGINSFRSWINSYGSSAYGRVLFLTTYSNQSVRVDNATP